MADEFYNLVCCLLLCKNSLFFVLIMLRCFVWAFRIKWHKRIIIRETEKEKNMLFCVLIPGILTRTHISNACYFMTAQAIAIILNKNSFFLFFFNFCDAFYFYVALFPFLVLLGFSLNGLVVLLIFFVFGFNFISISFVSAFISCFLLYYSWFY